MPIYRKPNAGKPAKGHKTYPYLLGGLQIDRPDQVWCADITGPPMRRGVRHGLEPVAALASLYLVATGSRARSNDFCVEALSEAIHTFGPPEIMNSDQGSQFTSFDWTDRLKRAKAKNSMDSKARYLDNIFIERRRSLTYECVYPHAWEPGSQAKAGVGRWVTFSNHQRPHAAHGGQPPAVVYFNATQTDQQVQAVA
jgi:putative transposase